MGHDLFGERTPGGTVEEKSSPQTKPQATAGRTASTRTAAQPTKPAPDSAGPKFEDAFARLEALVGEMERGELPLEQMLERFEEGVRLVRHCNEFLAQAQLRVERYVEQKDGHWVLKEL
jgi:exodeoxyribonuclease VII small subunit